MADPKPKKSDTSGATFEEEVGKLFEPEEQKGEDDDEPKKTGE
jgi:hypothetical protein